MRNGLIVVGVTAALTLTSGVGATAVANPAQPRGSHGTVCMTHHHFFRGLTHAHRTNAYRTRANPWAVTRVRCSGRWAVAGVSEGNRRIANTYTSVEHRSAGRGWHEVDRDRPCSRHRIPRPIYLYACDSN